MGSKWLARSGAIAVFSISTSLSAQTLVTDAGQSQKADGEKQSLIGDIIVTAQKRSESLQKVPMVIQAITGDALAQSSVTELAQLQNFIPALRLDKFSVFAITYLRGVGQGYGGIFTNNKVSTSLDGVDQPRYYSSSTYLYDVARVEVLNGPQGTLYGRNATGGAINVITNAPSSRFEAAAAVQMGDYNTLQTSGMINVPLSDSLIIRAAFQTQRHDGYITNGTNDENSKSGRIRILFRPTSKLSITTTVMAYENRWTPFLTVPRRADGSFFDPDNAWYYPNQDLNGYGSKNVNFHAYSEWNWDITPSLSATWLPAYDKMDLHNRALLNGTGYIQESSANQNSQEFRLSGRTSRLKWVSGAFYYHGNIRSSPMTLSQLANGTIQGSITGLGLVDPLRDQVKETSYALFGQGTYSINDTLRLTAGLRGSRDRKTTHQGRSTQLFTGTIIPLNIQPIGAPTIRRQIAGALSSSHVDYRIGVEYDVADRSMIFANVSTGYLQGGLTVSLGTNPINAFKPETLTAYEIGIKNRFLDNRLQLNLDAFYYDYSNLQLQTVDANIISTYLNAPRSRIYGGDISTVYYATPVDRLDISANLLSAKIVDFDIAGTTRSYDGYRLPQAPKYSVNLGYQHVFRLSNAATLTIHGDASLVGSQWGQFDHVIGSFERATKMFNANLRYDSRDDRWSVMAYVNNITKEPVDGSGGTGWSGLADPKGIGFVFSGAGLVAPRTYGIRASAKFR